MLQSNRLESHGCYWKRRRKNLQLRVLHRRNGLRIVGIDTALIHVLENQAIVGAREILLGMIAIERDPIVRTVIAEGQVTRDLEGGRTTMRGMNMVIPDIANVLATPTTEEATMVVVLRILPIIITRHDMMTDVEMIIVTRIAIAVIVMSTMNMAAAGTCAVVTVGVPRAAEVVLVVLQVHETSSVREGTSAVVVVVIEKTRGRLFRPKKKDYQCSCVNVLPS